MSIRITATALICLLLGSLLQADEHQSSESQEVVLGQRLQYMLRSIESLKAAGEIEMADIVAVKAEEIARRLTEMQQQRDRYHQEAQARQRMQEQQQWRAEMTDRLVELRELVNGLRSEVASLREEVGQYKKSQRAIQYGRVDLEGTWQLTLPAGYQYEVKISPRGDGLYQFDVPTVMRGVYRHRGDEVAIEIPSDERLTEFVWEFQDENLLMLTETPHVRKTGADYRGSVLQRSFEKPEPE